MKTATSKIYDFSRKQKIKAELSDHIQKKKCFFIEIGYGSEEAEQKALENMGDAEEISNEFSKLYNRFYNPAPDIAAFCVWFGILGIIYVIFDKYVFNDIGTVALCAGGAAFSSAIVFLFSAFSVIKKRKAFAVGNIIGCFVTAAFNLFCFASIDKVSNGSIMQFNNQIFGGYIPDSAQNESTPMGLILTAVVFTAELAVQTVILILLSKADNGNNSLKTNHFLKALRNALPAVSLVLIVLTAVFALRFFAFQNDIKEEYMKKSNLAFEIANQCETKQDVIDFVNNGNYGFKESKTGGEIDGYRLNGAIGNLSIDFIAEEEEDEGEENVLEKLSSIFINAVFAKYPESKERKNDYTINVSLSNLKNYKNGSDSISLAKLKTSEENLDRLYDFEAKYQGAYAELVDTYKSHCPVNVYFVPSIDKKRFNTKVTLTYAAGYGENSYNTSFDFNVYSEKAQRVAKQKELVIDTIRQNPLISNDELADAVGARIINSEYSYDELIFYLEQIQAVIDSNEELKSLIEELLETEDTDLHNYAEVIYNYMLDFEISDDLHFKTLNLTAFGKNEILVIFDSRSNIDFVSEESVNISDGEDSEGHYTVDMDNFRKISAGKGYYCSMKGNCYSDYEAVPYYTESGSRYRFITQNDEDGYKLYYLVNIHGDKHITYDCYIDKDGYLVFDDEKAFDKIPDSSGKVDRFRDENGNTYINALSASWDENGNILDSEGYFN